jgi:hypothetical protein
MSLNVRDEKGLLLKWRSAGPTQTSKDHIIGCRLAEALKACAEHTKDPDLYSWSRGENRDSRETVTADVVSDLF